MVELPRQPPELHDLPAELLRARVRERLTGRREFPGDLRIGPFPPEVTARIRALFPANPTPAHAARVAFLRSCSVKSFLRMRINFGVTSTNSSSLMTSSENSSS